MLEKIKSYSDVLVFFILELCLFLGFSFANSFLLYAVFAFILVIFAIIFSFDELKNHKRQCYSFLIFLIPFFIYLLLTACSRFSLAYVDTLSNMFICIGLLSVITLGYFSNYLKAFNIKICLYLIYASLALLVLICFIYNMVLYEPFYTFRYDGMYMYYDGDRYTVYDTIKFLMGFSFENVSIQHFQLYSTMLLTSVIAIPYVSYKKEKVMFFSFIGFALLGLISTLFTMDKVAILTIILTVIALAFILFNKKDNKICKYIIFTILGIFIILFIIFFLNSQSSWTSFKWLQDIIANNSILNKLFNSNRLSSAYKEILDGLLSFNKIFGYSGSSYSSVTVSNSWFFDTFTTSGLFGFAAFIVFLVFSTISIYRYNKESQDSKLVKQLINAFVLVFFVYSLIGYDMQPYSYYLNFTPMTQNSLFLIVVFLIGYTFTPKKVVEEETENIIEEINKEEVINEV